MSGEGGDPGCPTLMVAAAVGTGEVTPSEVTPGEYQAGEQST